MHDEMSIKSNLVYDRASGELVGFVDSHNWTSKRKDENEIGTHVLVFMVVGVASSLKMSLGYFCTISVTAVDIYPWFWNAVGIFGNLLPTKGFFSIIIFISICMNHDEYIRIFQRFHYPETFAYVS